MDKKLAMFKDEELLYISFNQDSSCFAAGTEKGFRIFNSYPFALKYERILDGGIGIIEMLNQSCLLVLVGGGKNPKYTVNKVILWDDHQTKVIQELKFTSAIKSVKIKKDKIIAVCDQRVFVYNLSTNKYLDPIDTYSNAKGIIGVNTDPNITVLGVPDKTLGHIKVKHYEKNFELVINAHEGKISCISINNDGTLLATASEMGKTVSVFFIQNGVFLQEYRRQFDKGCVNYIFFEATNKFMGSCTDQGTIFIWSLKSSKRKIREEIAMAGLNDNEVEGEGNDEGNGEGNGNDHGNGNGPKIDQTLQNIMNTALDGPENPINKCQCIGGNRNDNEFSYAQLTLKEDRQSICGFGPENKIMAINSVGKYYLCKMPIDRPGVCSVISEEKIINMKKKGLLI